MAACIVSINCILSCGERSPLLQILAEAKHIFYVRVLPVLYSKYTEAFDVGLLENDDVIIIGELVSNFVHEFTFCSVIGRSAILCLNRNELA